jgi:hypothetical protein
MTVPAQIDARPDARILFGDGTRPRCVCRTFENHVYGLRIIRIRFAPILVARALVFQAAWLLTEEGSRLPRERLQKGLLL